MSHTFITPSASPVTRYEFVSSTVIVRKPAERIKKNIYVVSDSTPVVRERELSNTMVNTLCEEEVNLRYLLE